MLLENHGSKDSIGAYVRWLTLGRPSPFRIAATRSFDPEPQREMDLMAWVNGMSRTCTRSRRRMYTAPANGVGTDGTKTVNRPSSSSSMMNAGTSASSISTSAGFHAFLVTVSRQSLCQTAQQAVPGKPLEEHHSPCAREPRAPSSSHGDTDEETERQHQDQRQEALSRDPVRDQRCDWPHQARDRLHALEQQQYRQVDGHDDEQAPDDRARDEFACVFHRAFPGPLFDEGPPRSTLAVRDFIQRREPHHRQGMSCARACGPDSCLFSPARFPGGRAYPVRRSRSEIPCARLWVKQAVTEAPVSGGLVDVCSAGSSRGSRFRQAMVC